MNQSWWVKVNRLRMIVTLATTKKAHFYGTYHIFFTVCSEKSVQTGTHLSIKILSYQYENPIRKIRHSYLYDENLYTWKDSLTVERVPRWSNPDSKVHGAHLGPVGPRWAPCGPHEPFYQGTYSKSCESMLTSSHYDLVYNSDFVLDCGMSNVLHLLYGQICIYKCW